MQDECDDEEAWLYWIDSNKEPHGKSIRHLAQDAKGNHKMDVDIITYYRYACASPRDPLKDRHPYLMLTLALSDRQV